MVLFFFWASRIKNSAAAALLLELMASTTSVSWIGQALFQILIDKASKNYSQCARALTATWISYEYHRRRLSSSCLWWTRRVWWKNSSMLHMMLMINRWPPIPCPGEEDWEQRSSQGWDKWYLSMNETYISYNLVKTGFYNFFPLRILKFVSYQKLQLVSKLFKMLYSFANK